MDNYCPNCGLYREKPYTRKAKCPACKESVYYRAEGQLLYARCALVFKEVVVVDAYKELRALLMYDDSIIREVEDSLKNRWHKTQIEARDIVWTISLSESLVVNLANNIEDGTKNIIAARVMEIHSRVERVQAKIIAQYHNEDPRSIILSSNREYLEGIKLHGFKYATLLSKHCCIECRKFEDWSPVSIDKELLNMRLPFANCSRFVEESNYMICVCQYISDYKECNPSVFNGVN